jgi:glutathione S-transferase
MTVPSLPPDKLTLGYWRLRGRAQPLRNLLAYSELDWCDRLYTSPEQWFGTGDKISLGLDFPNLPYLIHGAFKLTESNAIARYICDLCPTKELLGKNIRDRAQI